MFRSAFSYKELPEQNGSRRWKLTQDLVYEENSVMYITPAGFITDFASVPKIFRGWFPQHSVYSPAAVLHDWLYKYNVVTRKKADCIFLKSMLQLGVPYLTAKTMYLAVRLGGAGIYNKYKSRY